MNHHASMNRAYRLVWSTARELWVPAAENARGQGKRVARTQTVATLFAVTLGLGSLCAQAGVAPAGPAGGVISAGSGSITHSATLTTVTQTSPHLSLTWSSFNIPAQDTVDFVQPSPSAIAVNRILDVNASQILGQLNANGQVYLINPNGIVFGAGAEVNVGGLVASTLALDGDGATGETRSFSGDGTGSVSNQGTITAAPGGYVALLAQRVANSGVISAQLGTVALGAGSATTLKFSGMHLVSLQVDQSVLKSVAANGGLIRADGGQVIMTAGAQKSLVASVVNNSGIIEARTFQQHQGTITLLGGMIAGTVDVGGTLDASAPGAGNGGAIETSAAQVRIASSARVSSAADHGLTGSWLIDPTDFTIAAGAGSQSASGIGASTLQTALSGGNVSIATSASGSQNGDINVNAPVSWSANLLTLMAANNINVNAVMSVSGTAKADFEPGVNGSLLMGFAPDGSFAGRVDISSSAASALTIGGQVYTVITSLGAEGSTTGTDLQGINGNVAGNYALGSNIDASSAAAWNYGRGFAPLGPTSGPFSGQFNGLGHTVDNVTINVPNTPGPIGFFGTTVTLAVVENLGLTNLNVVGDAHVGGLAGTNAGASIKNSYASGDVSGSYEVGGLVGDNTSLLQNSHFSGTVTGGGSDQYIGGLVGENRSVIDLSYAAGSVTGGATGSSIGGLVGENGYGGVITRSYATATVTGDGPVGGLVGDNDGAAISTSYYTGAAVNGGSVVGGLVGYNYGPGGIITSSYANTQVNGTDHVGGLVGQNDTAIATSHASGSVNATGDIAGGLVGVNYGSVTASYANVALVGNNYVGGLVGTNHAAATIVTSFSTGSVTGGRYAGGLVGFNYGTASNTYSTASVIGTLNVGGLVGANIGGTVSNSYASGLVTGSNFVGALIGANYHTVTNSFYDSPVNPGLTGIGTDGGTTADVAGTVIGLSTANMRTQANFTSATAANGTLNPNWDFAATWVMYEGHTAPLLRVFMTPLTVTGSVAQTYDGAAFAPTIANLSYSIAPDFTHLFGTVTITGSAVGARHAGSYSFTPGGLYSDQLGYLIEPYLAGTLTINPAPLTVTGSTASKVYDGTTSAPVSGGRLVGVFAGDTVTLAQAGTYATTHAGTGIAVTAADSLGGASDADYVLVEPIGVTGSITPKPLSVSGTIVGTKIYNGSTSASLLDGTLSGLIPGDSVSLMQAGNFASASAGSGIAVTAADSLTGPSALDYSIIQPSGLRGTINPATSGNTPGTPGGSGTDGGAGSPLLAAYYASAQIDANAVAPQWGAEPQVIDASPSIEVVESASEPASTDAGVNENSPSSGAGQGVVINVAMNIGATGTLKIVGGGLRLPVIHVEGNP